LYIDKNPPFENGNLTHKVQRWARKFYFVSPKIANPQILGIIPQSQNRKFLRCARPQIANPKICNDKFANQKSENFLGVPVRKSQIRKEKGSVSEPDRSGLACL
jgi:hypothetical protein